MWIAVIEMIYDKVDYALIVGSEIKWGEQNELMNESEDDYTF